MADYYQAQTHGWTVLKDTPRLMGFNHFKPANRLTSVEAVAVWARAVRSFPPRTLSDRTEKAVRAPGEVDADC